MTEVKAEVKQQIKDAEILIKKPKGNDEFHMDVVAAGTMPGIALAIGKALCDLANTSEEMATTVYCLCKGIISQYEETEERL